MIPKLNLDPKTHQAIQPTLTDAHKASETKLDQIASPLLNQLDLGEKWQELVGEKAPSDRSAILRHLIMNVDDIQAEQVQGAWDDANQLAAGVSSFTKLCQYLHFANAHRDEDKSLARDQHGIRHDILKKISTVKNALEAAGEGGGQFPIQQLELIEQNAIEQIRKLEADRDEAVDRVGELPKAISINDLKTIEQAGDAIGRILGDGDLGHRLIEAEIKVKDPKAYQQSLAAFALFCDQASTTMDYKMVGMGWHNLKSRIDFRDRSQDGFNIAASEARLEETHGALLLAAESIADAKNPQKMADQVLIDGFIHEVGVDHEVAKKWKPTVEGVRKALQFETLMGLRALNETTDDMAACRLGLSKYGQEKNFLSAAQNITQHMVEGDYRDWRYENKKSAKQLGCLSKGQKKNWKADNVSVDFRMEGRTFTTREEDDVDLMWVTKIGGPSHGFDVGGHCLLPLLSNGRTKAIIIEDSQWPNAAARGYLRVLPQGEDGKPMLYLEPLQPDGCGQDGGWPEQHREHWGALESCLVRHALAKAEEMGVPIAVNKRYEEFLEQLGYPSEDVVPEFVLHPSAGVVEASDTLYAHDWVQNKTQVVMPKHSMVLVTP